MQRFSRSMALSVVLLCTYTLSAENPHGTKKPWEWTDEERLTIRFDPARAAAQAVEQQASGVMSRPNRGRAIHGNQSPELFLPIELFTSLLVGIESESGLRDSYRAGLRQRIAEFGLEEEKFWLDLEAAASVYTALFGRYTITLRALETPLGRGKQDLLEASRRMQPELCAARADAFTRARQHFGSERFQELLYRVVAPGLTISAPDSSAATPNQLRFVARGCR